MRERSRAREGAVLARRSLSALLLAGILAIVMFGCRDELTSTVDTNSPPDTYLTGVPAESTTAFYRVRLFWYGNDYDGRVVGYEFAITDSVPADPDTITFHYTTRTDSLFLFPVGASQQVLGHRFYVRAIDNDGAVDPEPAWTFFGALDLMPPSAIFIVAEAFNPDNGDAQELTSTNQAVPTDTVQTGWDVRFQWRGVDDDRMLTEEGDTVSVGEIRAYEYWLVPLEAAPNAGDISDTTALYDKLGSGKYYFSLRAQDEAGFMGFDPAIRSFVWNYDPKTHFRLEWDPEAADSAVVFYARSTGWEGDSLFFAGDTVPLGTSQSSVYSVTVRVGVWGEDPDDTENLGVSRFQYRLGAESWKPIQDTLGGYFEKSGLKTTDGFLNLRCADALGRPDGTPAQINFFVNRAPALLDTVAVEDGEPLLQIPYPNQAIHIDSIRAWGDSLKVRVRAKDPDETTDKFQYSFRTYGALFLLRNEDSMTGYREVMIPYPLASLGPDTLDVRIQEDAKGDVRHREARRHIPFRVVGD
jgi:hypothetical protein